MGNWIMALIMMAIWGVGGFWVYESAVDVATLPEGTPAMPIIGMALFGVYVLGGGGIIAMVLWHVSHGLCAVPPPRDEIG